MTLAELFDGCSQLFVFHLMYRPVEKLLAYKRRIGWTFPWVSAEGNGFNLDFSVFTDRGRRDGTGFNFGTAKNAGIDLRSVELHGLSAFALQDAVVHHTYSTYDRGTDVLNVDWQLLDRAPRGRGGDLGGWPRRRYEYELVTEWGQTPL